MLKAFEGISRISGMLSTRRKLKRLSGWKKKNYPLTFPQGERLCLSLSRLILGKGGQFK
jgi:hypothetical protein